MTFHYCIDRDGDPCFWYQNTEGYYILWYYSFGWTDTETKRMESFGMLKKTKAIDFPTVKEMINFMEREYPEYLL